MHPDPPIATPKFPFETNLRAGCQSFVSQFELLRFAITTARQSQRRHSRNVVAKQLKKRSFIEKKMQVRVPKKKALYEEKPRKDIPVL